MFIHVFWLRKYKPTRLSSMTNNAIRRMTMNNSRRTLLNGTAPLRGVPAAGFCSRSPRLTLEGRAAIWRSLTDARMAVTASEFHRTRIAGRCRAKRLLRLQQQISHLKKPSCGISGHNNLSKSD
jgi:hypothetical protein